MTLVVWSSPFAQLVLFWVSLMWFDLRSVPGKKKVILRRMYQSGKGDLVDVAEGYGRNYLIEEDGGRGDQ